jgi:glycerol-3-phosphate dehydrogenase
MAEKIYDVAVIGAGVCGAAITRALSAYRVETVLLEKCVDVAFGVSTTSPARSKRGLRCRGT